MFDDDDDDDDNDDDDDDESCWATVNPGFCQPPRLSKVICHSFKGYPPQNKQGLLILLIHG